MKMDESITIILNYLTEEEIALFTTGMISREAFAIKDREANFYMLGSMGLVSSVGLGIALNTDKKVFIFDGDGSILMDMGTMANIGFQCPSNLIHLVFDNEAYQSTGGQPTVSKTVQLDKIAKGSGYVHSVKVNTIEELKMALGNTMNTKGPHFILIKVLEKMDEGVERVSLTPFQIRERFMRSLNNK